jgi:excisionase family DNA binding protein
MQIAMTDVLELLTTEQAAARTGLSVNTLMKHRKQNRGMPFLRIGGRTVRYRTADVEAYLIAQTVHPGGPGEITDNSTQPNLRWNHPAFRGFRPGLR